ncbi:hypothetical protein BDU57DRAFT_559505 [Ampelomyces quisqualis]|uniref:Uncharacterized protein n=1 Tax=Ampelomyces quisqualis TaxID=50730 RepID=A0A6A5QCL1_AMPQU|nr:hypothetical protein BDU57DRAFT_559505 [Ampelomyces quisqualis]
MQSLRSITVTAARKGRVSLPRQPRRYHGDKHAHDEHAHNEHGHGHGHEPVNEPMGRGFYATVACIPAAWALYYASRNASEDSQPFLTRMINRYTATSELWARRNDLHVRMIEQAGEDRVLFQNSKPCDHVDMRFPEIMNVGSPYNVPAGSQVPMEKVIAKYKKIAYEDNERKLEALRENKMSCEQPFEKTYLRKAPDLLPPADTLQTPAATPPRPSNPNAMPPYSAPRHVSGPLAVENAPNGSDAGGGAPWARPNFHSTPSNSKTSQYIDKITSENDRLRRELKVEKLAREEEAKRVSAARSRAEDSRADYQHLQVLADTNARAIERKDRKLEELKAALEAEVNRRKVAEQRAEEALKMLGDTRSETQRQLSQAYEMKHYAENQLDTVRDGYKRQLDGLQNKAKSLHDDLQELRRQRSEDADKIKRQAIISDQLHHEMSRNARTETNLASAMDAYKEEHRKDIDRLSAEAAQMRSSLPDKEREAERLIQVLNETRDKMQWVMTQQKRQTAPVGKKRQGAK